MKSWQSGNLVKKLKIEIYPFRNKDHVIMLFAEVILISEFSNKDHFNIRGHADKLSGC